MDAFKIIYGSGDVSFLVLLVDIFLGLILSLIICQIYRITFSGITYSHTFLLSLVMITMTVAVLISVIGGNLARAFSLVGALSIIRYRTAIKDARDTGFIFLSVATGMVIGAGYYLIAIGLVFFISIALVVLHKINFASEVIYRNVVKVSLAADKDSQEQENKIRKILNAAYKQVSLIEHFLDKGDIARLTFVASSLGPGERTKRQRERQRDIIDRIKSISGIKDVGVVTDQLQQNI